MVKITAEEILTYSPLNTGGSETVPVYERKMLSLIYSFISKKKRFVVAIDGLRRVGKTVLLKQLLNKLQKDGRSTFYFSFDKKVHQNPEVLEEVVRFFIGKDREAVICLDEVGKVEDWAGIVKKYYDSSKATFFVSSSAALQIKKGKESLAGRMINYTLPPLSFNEYLELKNLKKEKIKFDFSKPEKPTIFKEHLSGFLNKGSYPELADIEDKNIIANYIKNSTIEKMIFEDIPSIFKISHVSKLFSIFEYFANYSGDFIHEKTIAGLIGLSEPTVSDYITYLEESHLIKRVYTEANYSKKIRKKKKGYVASPSIYSNTTSNFSQGKLIETAVFEKLMPHAPLTYLDIQKHEVDFILKTTNGIFPIEVKSSSNVSLSDLQGLLYYMKEKKVENGYVIYNGPYDYLKSEEKIIHLIPLSSFLASDEIFV